MTIPPQLHQQIEAKIRREFRASIKTENAHSVRHLFAPAALATVFAALLIFVGGNYIAERQLNLEQSEIDSLLVAFDDTELDDINDYLDTLIEEL